jgi:hypothetical protein
MLKRRRKKLKLEELIKLYEEKQYSKMIKLFPQDRAERLEVIGILVEALKFKRKFIGKWRIENTSSFKSGVIKRKNKIEYFVIGASITYSYYNKYDFRKSNTENRYGTFVIGEDDSGLWVEVLGFVSESVDYEADEVLSMLNAEQKFSGKFPMLEGGWVTAKRMQGDINLVGQDLANYLSDEFFHYITGNSNIDFLEYGFLNFIDIVIYFETALGMVVYDKPSFEEFKKFNRIKSNKLFGIDEAKLKPLYEELIRLSYEVLNRAKYLFKPCNNAVINFQNHKITLHNTSVPFTVIDQLNNAFIVFDEAEVVIESPHHKTVKVDLSSGVYSFRKSGGMAIEAIRSYKLRSEENLKNIEKSGVWY